MIVRIATEGQYELADKDVPMLNELDNDAVAVCNAGDEKSFRAAYAKLLDYVRGTGSLMPPDTLAGSDLILPPPDVSLAEAQAEFSGEGLIPG